MVVVAVVFWREENGKLHAVHPASQNMLLSIVTRETPERLWTGHLWRAIHTASSKDLLLVRMPSVRIRVTYMCETSTH